MNCPVASAAGKSAGKQMFAIETPCAAVGGDRATERRCSHLRGRERRVPCCKRANISQPITRRAVSAEIVSEGRPQRSARRNRIARANKSGAAGTRGRRQASASAPIATKTWYHGGLGRGERISKSSGVAVADATLFHSPFAEGGAKIGLLI